MHFQQRKLFLTPTWWLKSSTRLIVQSWSFSHGQAGHVDGHILHAAYWDPPKPSPNHHQWWWLRIHSECFWLSWKIIIKILLRSFWFLCRADFLKFLIFSLQDSLQTVIGKALTELGICPVCGKNVPFSEQSQYSFAGRCCKDCLPAMKKKHEYPGWYN